MKDYQLKKDSDGFTVWGFGKFIGRFYKTYRDGRPRYKVPGNNELWIDKSMAMECVIEQHQNNIGR